MARNTLWNFVGHALPLVVGIATIPFLIRALGTERFGVLTLAWVVIGYFGLFDFGLGRALTKLVAEKLGSGISGGMSELVWTALALMAGLGLVGAVVLWILTPWLTTEILTMPDPMRPEASGAFRLLAVTIPIVITTPALRGVLEAHQRFGLVAAVRIPLGVWTFLGPLAVTLVVKDLVSLVLALSAARVVAWIVYLFLCTRVVPELRHVRLQRDPEALKRLLSFGGWMTVSNVVGPLMVYLDRFVIGAVMTMAAVAYYATPFEVVTRLWIIPTAIVGVLFPAFSIDLVRDRARAARIFERGISYVFVLLFPVTLLVVVFAPEGLTLWLGDEFARESAPVLRWLAVGVLVNSIARVPFVLIQADGRPDLTAKLHLLELPLYLGLLTWLLYVKGIEGCAMAWMLRCTVDAGALCYMAAARLAEVRGTIMNGLLALGAGGVALGVGALTSGTLLKSLLVFSLLLVFLALAWRVILRREERRWVGRLFHLGG